MQWSRCCVNLKTFDNYEVKKVIFEAQHWLRCRKKGKNNRLISEKINVARKCCWTKNTLCWLERKGYSGRLSKKASTASLNFPLMIMLTWKKGFPTEKTSRVEKETVLQFEALSKKNQELWVLIEKRKWKLQMGNQILSTLSDWQWRRIPLFSGLHCPDICCKRETIF